MFRSKSLNESNHRETSLTQSIFRLFFQRQETEIYFDAEEFLSHPIDDLAESEKRVDFEEIRSHPLERTNSCEHKNRVFDFSNAVNFCENQVPLGAIRFQENSYIRKKFSFMGPELHIHLGYRDVIKMMNDFQHHDSKSIHNVIEEMTNGLLKIGFQESELIHAAKMSGYDSYFDHAKAMIKKGILDYYEEAKNTDGSVDIYQPGLLLISPIKRTRVGTKWFRLPTKENSLEI